jgi:hypothetical protein
MPFNRHAVRKNLNTIRVVSEVERDFRVVEAKRGVQWTPRFSLRWADDLFGLLFGGSTVFLLRFFRTIKPNHSSNSLILSASSLSG